MELDSLSSILGSLSDEDIASLKGIAQSFMQGEEKSFSDTKQSDSGEFETAEKIISIMGALNSPNDDRTALIHALKPFLSEERRKKADEAAKMLKIISLLPVLKELLGII